MLDIKGGEIMSPEEAKLLLDKAEAKEDVWTWFDEYTENIIKYLVVLFLIGGIIYLMVCNTGKEVGMIDPNFLIGSFLGSFTTILAVYFSGSKKKSKR